MAVDEVVGVIKGLADVVKDQKIASKDSFSKTQQHIQDLFTAVQALSNTVGTKDASSTPLRVPQLTLPDYTGRENIDHFAEQLTNVLSSSGEAGKFWLTYLKQQCRNESLELSAKTSYAEYLKSYNQCLTLLTHQRGVPKEQQIRQLLSTYYSMSQKSTESVADFSHCFLETQHCLEKLIPGIHRVSGDLELIHIFMLKLHPALGMDLVSGDSTFTNPTAVIEAARRLESAKPIAYEEERQWTPQALYAQPPKRHASKCSPPKPKSSR